MGFGFNLFVAPLLFLLLIGLIIFSVARIIYAATINDWSIAKNHAKGWGFAIGIIICFALLVSILRVFNTKMEVTKDDIYGEYIIDRNMFKGVQADWQYNRYRFKVAEDDILSFYLIDGKTILDSVKINVSFVSRRSDRVKLEQLNIHHILSTNPTLHRDIWDFYYSFYSEKYGNMYFKKGDWKPLSVAENKEIERVVSIPMRQRESKRNQAKNLLQEHPEFENYTLHQGLKESIITGDFFGGSIEDIAILIKNANGEIGIGIIDTKADKVAIKVFGGKADPFEISDYSWIGDFTTVPCGDTLWSNYIDDFRCLSAVPNNEKVTLSYNAIYVHAAESCGGGFIYWKNGKFNWLQQE